MKEDNLLHINIQPQGLETIAEVLFSINKSRLHNINNKLRDILNCSPRRNRSKVDLILFGCSRKKLLQLNRRKLEEKIIKTNKKMLKKRYKIKFNKHFARY
jgi:hypothetical protein